MEIVQQLLILLYAARCSYYLQQIKRKSDAEEAIRKRIQAGR